MNKLYQNDGPIACPRCGSNQVTATKRGYSGCSGILGYLLFGGWGLLLGFLGESQPKMVCMRCGHEFGPPSTSSCLALFCVAVALMMLALMAF